MTNDPKHLAWREMQALAGNAPDLIYRIDRQMRHVFVNQRVLDMTGMKREEYLGRTNRELGHPPELCDLWEAAFRRTFETREAQEVEFTFENPAGPSHLSMRVVPEFSDDGSVETIMGITRDVTEQKRAEAEREASGSLLQAAIQNTPAVLALFSGPEFRFEIVNPAYQQLAPGKPMQGRTLRDVWPEIYETIGPVFQRVYDTGEPFSAADQPFEIRSAPDGPLEKRYFNWSLQRVELPGRADWGLLNTAVETTASKQAAESLAAAHRLMQDLIDNTTSMIFACDLEERFVLANAPLAALLKTTPAQLVGKRRHEFMPQADADAHEANDREVIAAGRAVEVEERSDLHGRSITWLSTKFPLRDAQGRIYGVAGIVTDITARKQAEEELERVRNMLAEAQRIAHLGSFEYVAATRTTVWSEEEYRIYGLDTAGPSPAYDVMLEKCIHPDDAVMLHETFMKAVQNRTVYELEHRIVRPDGSVRWVYDRAHPYLDEAGGLVRYVGATLDITDRKQAEEKLREAHERTEWLARFPRENPWPVLRATVDGRVLHANPAVAQSGMWTRESGTLLVEPLCALVQASAEAKAPIERDVKLRDKIYSVAVALFPQEGYANLYGRDVTDQRRAEAREREVSALAAASQTAVDILDAMGEGVLLLDMEGRIVSVNPAMEELAGIPAGEQIGRPVRDLLPEVLSAEDQALAAKALTEALKGKIPELPPLTVLSRTGSRTPVIPSVTFVRGPNKRPTEIVATLRDISELRAAQNSLEESNALLERIFDNTHLSIAYLDRDLNFVRVNRAYADACQHEPGFFPGKNHFDLYPHAENEAIFRKVVETGESFAIHEKPFEFPDHPEWGVTYWDWTLRPLQGEQGHAEGLLFCLLDRTDRVRARQNLVESERKYSEQLRELANRLATTEEQERRRVSTQIHDTVIQTLSLGNIRLGGIRNAVEKADLAEQCEKVDQLRKMLDTGIAECRGLMSELTPPLLYELGVGPALKDFARKQQEIHGVTITVEEDGHSAALPDAQRGLLFQAARELVMNALKHAGTSEVCVSLSRVDEQIQLQVRDTGRGFDPAALNEELADFGKGGFGLFNIRERLRGLGGRLDIDSAPGKGATIAIRLPVGSGGRRQGAGGSSTEE